MSAEAEILLTFKRRKHEELIDYGIFLGLTLQLSAGTGGNNAVIVEKTTASPMEKTSVNWQKMADGMSKALIKHFWGANFKGYENRYYFNYGSDLSNMTTNHYYYRRMLWM